MDLNIIFNAGVDKPPEHLARDTEQRSAAHNSI